MKLPDHAPSSLNQSDAVTFLLPAAYKLLLSDFATSGITTALPDTFEGSVFELRSILAAQLSKVVDPNGEAVYRLLYRCDIPESKLTSALHGADGKTYHEVIAELMIIRALQRCYYRIKFGGGS